MELRTHHVIAADDGRDRPAVIGSGENVRRVGALRVVAVHEIGMVAVMQAGEQGVRGGGEGEVVPAHVGDFEGRGVRGEG